MRSIDTILLLFFLIMIFLVSCGSDDGGDSNDVLDGDTTETITPDGDNTDEDMIDGDTSDGDILDGDEDSLTEQDEEELICLCSTDEDCPPGHYCEFYPDMPGCGMGCFPIADGDVDGDNELETDGDNACTSHESYTCVNGDIWWFDSCGTMEEKKESCSEAGCNGNVCNSASFPCANGVCTDTATGFHWQQQAKEGNTDLASAISYCENLTLNGGGWRLPNISELRTLIRNCEAIETSGSCHIHDVCTACGTDEDDVCLSFGNCYVVPDCDPGCPDDGGPSGCYWPEQLGGECHWYWSTSPVEDYSTDAWGVGFGFGVISSLVKSNPYYVRCMRDESFHDSNLEGNRDID